MIEDVIVKIDPLLKINKDSLNDLISLIMKNNYYHKVSEDYYYITIKGTKEQNLEFDKIISSKNVLKYDFDNVNTEKSEILIMKQYKGITIKFITE